MPKRGLMAIEIALQHVLRKSPGSVFCTASRTKGMWFREVIGRLQLPGGREAGAAEREYQSGRPGRVPCRSGRPLDRRGNPDHIRPVTRQRAPRTCSKRPRSAATDLARRPRARDEAPCRGRLPRLLRLVFWCTCLNRRGRIRRSSSRFRCGFGPCGSRLCVVLFQTAMFVFAAGTAMTELVAPRSCAGRKISHSRSVRYRLH
jgi:hypothetical protein